MMTRLGIAALITLVYLSGLFEVADLKLLDTRFSLVQRPAHANLIVVAIDPPSLRRMGHWPWPRSVHAFLIERLSEAGAAEVAIDVDFSSRSNEDNDAALERALEAFQGQVVLPGFVQNADPLRHGEALISTLPLDRFLRHADVASVNVVPDRDGLVRRMSTTAPLRGYSVPSLSSTLSRGSKPGSGSFTVDFGIRLNEVPVVSFVDVLTGSFVKGLFEGRTVLIGPTAFELGDVLQVPLYGALPGVMFQALATESLDQNRALTRVPPWLVVIGVFALSLLMGGCFRDSGWRRGLVWTIALPPLLFLASCLLQQATPLVLDVVPLATAVIAAYALGALRTLHRQSASLLTHRHALVREERFTKSVLEHTFDAIITVAPDGRITSLNRSAKAILADSDGEALGQNIGAFILQPDGDRASACGILRLAQIAAAAAPCELTGRRRTGQDFPLDVAVSCFEENRQTTYIVLLRDITARKKAEVEAEAFRQELVSAKERAEAADHAKTEFLANMSHELRTPLNAIIGFSDVLKDEMFGPLGNETYIEYAKDIHESGQHLLSVISDILDISRIESGTVVLREETFKLNEAIDACLRMVRYRAQAASIALQAAGAQTPVEVRGDQRLIKQAVINVLSNALKFTPPNGVVTVETLQEDTGAVSFTVTDTGRGIAEEDLAAVFEPFRQLDSALTRSFEGVGLGLPLTKAFVELHGGRIEIGGTTGEGARVTLTLPPERVISYGTRSSLRLVKS